MLRSPLHRFLLLLFFIAGGLSVVLGGFVSAHLAEASIQVVSRAQQVMVLLAGVGAGIVFATKLNKRLVWESVFFLGVFLGAWYLGLMIFPWKIALFLVSAMTLSQFLIRNVLMHNAFYLAGSLGIALNFAGWLAPEVLVVLLVAFTAYDMLAAHPDGPIVILARQLIRWKIVPGFILPPQFSGLFQSVDRMTLRDPSVMPVDVSENVDDQGLQQAALLGAGDIILPAAIIIRAALVDVRLGMCCFIGLMGGALLLAKEDLHPRAALPPLAVGVAIPFVAFLLVGYFVS